MRTVKTTRTFARALFRTAQQQGRLPAVYADLQYLEDVLEQCGELRVFLPPFVAIQTDRRGLLRRLFHDRLDRLTCSFLDLLEQKHVLHLLPEVIPTFDSYYCHARGLVRAGVDTAHPLSDDQVAAFRAALQRCFGPDTVMIVRDNPALRAGFVIATDDHIYDYSLAGRLERLRRRMLGP